MGYAVQGIAEIISAALYLFNIRFFSINSVAGMTVGLSFMYLIEVSPVVLSHNTVRFAGKRLAHKLFQL
jgi:hypothetical protein